MKKFKHLGQITIRRMGRKYLLCISGNPKKIFNNIKEAEKIADKIRLRYGRRPKRKKS